MFSCEFCWILKNIFFHWINPGDCFKMCWKIVLKISENPKENVLGCYLFKKIYSLNGWTTNGTIDATGSYPMFSDKQKSQVKEVLFNKVAGLSPAILFKKRLFKNTFWRHFWGTVLDEFLLNELKPEFRIKILTSYELLYYYTTNQDESKLRLALPSFNNQQSLKKFKISSYLLFSLFVLITYEFLWSFIFLRKHIDFYFQLFIHR